MSNRLPSSCSSWQSLAPWAVGIAGVALATGLHVGSPNGLWAAEGFSANGSHGVVEPDSDGDGLLDVLEQVLWLDPDRADSDRDGWRDAEELARGSNPKSAASVPAPQEIGLGVHGYSVDGRLHVVLAIYQRGGVGADHAFELSAVTREFEVALLPRDYVPLSRIEVVEGFDPQDTVHLIDMELPGRIVRRFGELSFALRGAEAGASMVTEAAAMTVTTVNGSPFAVGFAPAGAVGGLTPPAKGGNRSTIYQSLVPSTRISSQAPSSSDGQICVQSTRVVGSGGSSVVLEVVKGVCQDGDGACPSSCSGSAGSTISVVDPIALLGG